MGFELFDKGNWAASDFDDKVNYQRALEGELERTIQAMSGVAAARVHLAIPPDSIYSGQDRQAKAGVILKLRDHRLTAAMRLAVQRLVSSAVDKLDPQSVTVVDAEAGATLDAATAQSASEEHSAEEVLAARLLHTLEPVVGSRSCARHSSCRVRLRARWKNSRRATIRQRPWRSPCSAAKRATAGRSPVARPERPPMYPAAALWQRHRRAISWRNQSQRTEPTR